MIGGGQGSFIGAVHRIAANLDGQIELVCGCFSSNPENSRVTGESLFLPPERVYSSWQEMLEKEAQLPEGVRMDFVSIVTPNHVHFAPAMMALEKGFHVALDKPMTFSLEEAKQLAAKVKETGKLFLLTHTYTGYPKVKYGGFMWNIRKDGYITTVRQPISRLPGVSIRNVPEKPVVWEISVRMPLTWLNTLPD